VIKPRCDTQTPRSHGVRRLSAAAVAALLCALLQAPAGAGAIQSPTTLGSLTTGGRLSVSATLEQCLTAESQDERSATFAGEMNAVPGTTRMEMRIDVLERSPGDTAYRTVNAPGLGVWRASVAGVKVYKYLKQVTNLSGPAFYRAAVRFRWLNAKGRLIAATELHTRRCEQPGATTPTTSPTSPTEPSASTPPPATPTS
jgi:hypothetical protein